MGGRRFSGKEIVSYMLLDVKRTEKWIAALENNAHRQIRFALRDRFTDGVCAVGCIYETDPAIEAYPIGMDKYIPWKLLQNIVTLNDGCLYRGTKPHTFQEIANILKVRLRAQQEFLAVKTTPSRSDDDIPTYAALSTVA